MRVVACVICGAQVNTKASACPECGTDPRVPAEEARAHYAAHEAAEREQRDAQVAGASGHERFRMLRNDPAALARWATKAGLGWLRLEVEAKQADESLARAIGVTDPGESASVIYFIDAVEAEGWQLESMEHLYRPTGITFVGAFGVGVNHIEGKTSVVCLFRKREH